MPKRKRENDEHEVDKFQGANDESLPRRGILADDPIDNEYENLDDSDEEDCLEGGEKKDERLDFRQKTQKHQEPATITKDGDIKITPFNLNEELEEGQFDRDGNFIFKKKDDDQDEEADDTWAETVDWAEVERKEKERHEEMIVDEAKTQPDEETLLRDEQTCYREMLRIMQPDESVQKTIRRLGNSIPRRRPFNKNARKQPDTSGPSDSSAINEAKRKLDLMIELADLRLRDGDMDIYQKTYDDLEDKIN